MFMQDISRTSLHTAVAAPAAHAKTAPQTRLFSGLTAGTLVETATGWRGVETLRSGDRVQSFDGGLRQVVGLDRGWLLPGEAALLLVPGGAFDNCTDLTLAPDQHLLIDTEGDAELPDDAMALIPAAALVGFRGTSRLTKHQPVELITPLFADVEAIWTNSGTLLHCPAIKHGAGRLPQGDDFTRLDLTAARALLRRLDSRNSPLPAALRFA
ncbi:Hint domain-containing protein [Rhodobacter ferrooxidans]|uniref:Hedgehog/Intein (Hint) domain-containing protein n=1 Tax=Rhodobacter ferrooxidans TaxID=371731 RepID=C8S4E7_9RHOB|nr:Hint domain-containing protein [Rhodobacter sp. SW2]EEW24114.1 hypothetical protein Rsw2DRAFT_2925 [Rhodobacter sp. SW2]